MKKLILIFTSIILLQQVNAQQSFDKGSLVVTANYGFDLYSVAQKYHYINSDSTSTKTSGAGSTNWNLEGEYGLFKWLGVGLHFKLDNYITSRDSTTGYKPTAIGFETGLLINAHIIRAKHFDLLVGANIGLSWLTYTIDALNDQVYGSGTWTDFHASARFYFGRFGLNINFYIPDIYYPSLTTNNSNIPIGESILAQWKANGFGTSVGLQYRILN